ncbi:type II toxin-antitoxin system RelE/ParE family toxin [Mesorhizobium sp. M0140]
MSYWPRLSCSVFGPQLGRPHADTLNDSSFANMKELRFDADDGVWRVAFASTGSGRRSCSSPAISRA